VDPLEKQFDYFSLLEVMAFEELWMVLSWNMRQVVFCCSEKTIAPLYIVGNMRLCFAVFIMVLVDSATNT
jgi:hypothetical protein